MGASVPAVREAWGSPTRQWGGAQSFSRPCREGRAEPTALGQHEPHVSGKEVAVPQGQQELGGQRRAALRSRADQGPRRALHWRPFLFKTCVSSQNLLSTAQDGTESLTGTQCVCRCAFVGVGGTQCSEHREDGLILVTHPPPPPACPHLRGRKASPTSGFLSVVTWTYFGPVSLCH